VVCMIYTWLKNGKPDVSMCLNASLAGLVGITAGCASLDATGSFIVGIVSGILVVFFVETLDIKFHIDDPVGAVGVHFANGIWGGLAVGLLATDTAPLGNGNGLIYGLIRGDAAAGAKLFGVQLLGVFAIAAWTTVTMIIVFKVIKATVGLRVSKEEEISGLDQPEHGLPSAYPDFAVAVDKFASYSDIEEHAPVVTGTTPPAEAVTVKKVPSFVQDGKEKLTKIEIICKDARFEALKVALSEIGITGMTVTHVMGCGVQKGQPEYYRGVAVETNLLPKVQVEVVVSKVPVSKVVETAKKVLYTGHIGDGKIFVYDVENVIKVRTGEEGYDALQDSE
jgi:Ammonia permease